MPIKRHPAAAEGTEVEMVLRPKAPTALEATWCRDPPLGSPPNLFLCRPPPQIHALRNLNVSKMRQEAQQAWGSKHRSSMASASVPDFRFLPCVSSCPDFFSNGMLPGSIKWNNPFPRQLAVGRGVLSQHRNPRSYYCSCEWLRYTTFIFR